MKKFALILCIGFLGFTMNAQEQATSKKNDEKAPIFKFETEVLNYGEIAHNSDGVRVLKFTNVGKSPLIITNVKGSCGCTVPTRPKEPIMPGAQGEIQVKYATNRIGPFSKTVTITSNAKRSTVVIPVKGKVLNEKDSATLLQKKKTVVSQ
ncbi:MAG TPA: DUF1573 domain-containing protein [Flavobacteriia bacterium]|jgi:hypothetical protein|nr:DUF1573 domain-containing protein [Flavobacteriia bacterium]